MKTWSGETELRCGCGSHKSKHGRVLPCVRALTDTYCSHWIGADRCEAAPPGHTGTSRCTCCPHSNRRKHRDSLSFRRTRYCKGRTNIWMLMRRSRTTNNFLSGRIQNNFFVKTLKMFKEQGKKTQTSEEEEQLEKSKHNHM